MSLGRIALAAGLNLLTAAGLAAQEPAPRRLPPIPSDALETLRASRSADENAIEQLGGVVEVNWTGEGTPRIEVARCTIRVEWKGGDDGLKHLKGVPSLRSLEIRSNAITDAGLRHLQGLAHLTGLEVESAKVTDAGLQSIAGLTQLQSLDVSGCPIGDKGIEQLHRLQRLKTLIIEGTQMTDDGLARLAALRGLERVYLCRYKYSWSDGRFSMASATMTSSQGIQAFRAKRPDVAVVIGLPANPMDWNSHDVEVTAK